MPRPEIDKQTAIAALECALHNYQIDRVGPYTLAIISDADLAILQHRVKELESFARNVATNYDHDEEAHKYGTSCRVCDAHALLKN